MEEPTLYEQMNAGPITAAGPAGLAAKNLAVWRFRRHAAVALFIASVFVQGTPGNWLWVSGLILWIVDARARRIQAQAAAGTEPQSVRSVLGESELGWIILGVVAFVPLAILGASLPGWWPLLWVAAVAVVDTVVVLKLRKRRLERRGSALISDDIGWLSPTRTERPPDLAVRALQGQGQQPRRVDFAGRGPLADR